MENIKYKVGDKVVANIIGRYVIGTIENIEYDESKRDYVADLDCGNWVYLDQIRSKCED